MGRVGTTYKIYMISREVTLLAVDINAKQILWNFQDDVLPGESILSTADCSVVDSYGNIYCATDSVYSFDFTGNLRWKNGLDNISDCPLICDDNGSVYVGTMGISMMGFDTDGNQLWKIDDNQNQVGGSPAIGFSEIMYFPTWSSDKLYGIE